MHSNGCTLPAEDLRDGLERLPAQPQLTGSVDAGVAREHLLDQRCPGSRQAEDEDRPA